MMTPEQMMAANKSSLETMFGLTAKVFEGMEKLVDLNLQAARAAMTEAQETAQAAMAVRDVQELLALQAGVMQPLAEKASAYTRHLYEIAQGTGAEMGRAIEATAGDTQAKMMSMVDGAAKNAPAGSEAVVAVFKSAMAASTNALESMQKAAKQATDVAQANFDAMTATAANATTTSGKRSSAKARA